MPEDREFLGEFFQLYKEQPCLWQVKSKDYLNKYKKNEAYGKLAEKLKEKYPDATTDLVKKKINIYRSNFRKEAKKVADSMRSGSGTDDVYTPSWTYYKDLLFLKDQEAIRTSTSNLEAYENDASSTMSSELMSTKKKQNVPEFEDDEVPKPSSSTNASKAPLRSETEYDLWARTWASDLQKMEPVQQLYAKKAINDILFEGQMGTLHRNSVRINCSSNFQTHDNPCSKPTILSDSCFEEEKKFFEEDY